MKKRRTRLSCFDATSPSNRGMETVEGAVHLNMYTSTAGLCRMRTGARTDCGTVRHYYRAQGRA